MMMPPTAERVSGEKKLRVARHVRSDLRNFHWAMSLFLIATLLPAFHCANLPFDINWAGSLG